MVLSASRGLGLSRCCPSLGILVCHAVVRLVMVLSASRGLGLLWCCPPLGVFGLSRCCSFFPQTVLAQWASYTFRVKQLVADRNGARGGGTGPWFRRSRCGFARSPLRFDAPTVVSCESRCISMLPVWFRANSGLSWSLQASSGGAT